MQLQQLQNDQYVSCLYWMQVGSVNATTFSKAFHEWRYCNFGMRKLKHSPLFECPCCVPLFNIQFMWMETKSSTDTAKFPGIILHICIANEKNLYDPSYSSYKKK